ncbi:TPR-like protein [Collybia nuda]|uniref:TPR-like protein n=1 Tax=Collybia nuda TaxID=64659 RepID=A0A9P5Y5A6_9AGAR|nr:TPR-like protein [Collybia nuda]
MGAQGSTMGPKHLSNVKKLENKLNKALLKGKQISECYVNLGLAYHFRYRSSHQQEDLDNVVVYYMKGLEAGPASTYLLEVLLNNLGIALQTRFELLRDMQDLEKAIAYHDHALELPGQSNKSMSLGNLASALQIRYGELRTMEDLERAIIYQEQALELHPPDEHDGSRLLNNLATALETRYWQLGEKKDLDKAIVIFEQALGLQTLGHPMRSSSLTGLANVLQARYDQLEEVENLEKSIIYLGQALNLCSPSHPDRSKILNNLANSLQKRYHKLGGIEDLEVAITCYEEALTLSPYSHPNRSNSLNNLALVLQIKYKQLMEIQYLEKAITLHEQALDSCPPNSPERSMFLYNLGWIFYTKYIALGKTEDLEQSLTYYKQAAFSINSSLLHRFIAAKQWAHISQWYNISSALPAYTLALDLQQQHLALLPSLVSQQGLIEKSSQLSVDAAACALSTSTPEVAVELLEQGRSILWSKIQGYRKHFDEILEVAPHLAQEFQNISHQLEHNAVSPDVNIIHQHALYEKWERLLVEIRKLDGFSDFLKAAPFHFLQSVSTEGPVIMVNISLFRSDAIVLVPHRPPVVVPLYEATPQLLKNLVDQISMATMSPNSSTTIYHVLQHIWSAIVGPVIKQLTQQNIAEKTHIWWCPTSYLCALPIHAAGPYKKGLKNLPDLYISSYTPTLLSLIRARSKIPKPQSALGFLLIGQPDDTIPHVFEEIKVIKNFKKHSISYSGQDVNIGRVLEALQSHSWVHFACHGHLDIQPFKSWFQLYNNEHLTVLDLAMAKLPNAEFAFLSACHSAASSIHGTPDESIHLAGALQFSGFNSVIGTLWAMIDDDGPAIAIAFYRHMFYNADTVNIRDAAMALNIATRELRKQKVPVDRWINFIHIGA